MTHVQIAPTTQTDLDKVLDIARKTLQSHRKRQPQYFSDLVLYKIEELHRDAVDLAGTSPTSFSAHQDGAFAGYVLLRHTRNGATIYDIGVLPNHRRQGIARALLTHAVKIAKQRNWPTLSATVWYGNGASHRLFQTSGFAAPAAATRSIQRFGVAPPKVTYRRPIA